MKKPPIARPFVVKTVGLALRAVENVRKVVVWTAIEVMLRLKLGVFGGFSLQNAKRAVWTGCFEVDQFSAQQP